MAGWVNQAKVLAERQIKAALARYAASLTPGEPHVGRALPPINRRTIASRSTVNETSRSKRGK